MKKPGFACLQCEDTRQFVDIATGKTVPCPACDPTTPAPGTLRDYVRHQDDCDVDIWRRGGSGARGQIGDTKPACTCGLSALLASPEAETGCYGCDAVMERMEAVEAENERLKEQIVFMQHDALPPAPASPAPE